jgi:purine-binding chemotaxis protein CheW
MPASDTEHQLVGFSLHGEHYALPIASVREIIRYTAPTATAAARGMIRGMISLRGRVLPVVDLSTRLGRELEIGRDTRILVVEIANGSLGVIVDAVDGVLHVPAAQVEPLPTAPDEDGLGNEIAAVGDRLILLIDPERALAGILPSPPKPRRSPTRPKPAGARAPRRPPS